MNVDKARRLLSLLTEIYAVEARIRGEVEVAEALQEAFAGSQTEVHRVIRTIEVFDQVHASGIPIELKDWLLHAESPARLPVLCQYQKDLLAAGKDLAERWQAFQDRTSVRTAQWFRTEGGLGRAPLHLIRARGATAAANAEHLAEWLDLLRASESLQRAGLAALAELADAGSLKAADLVPAFDYIAANSLVQEAFDAHPDRAHFTGLSHEVVRARFAALDKECLELYRKRAASEVDKRPVPMGIGTGPISSYTERHLIEREIKKQKRHLPLRQLVTRAGRALQGLKPCFMMGPLSVAQYLPPGRVEFDLVIMDEASQLRPEDALGAIARAEQVVIVGDRMQLPPTSFFDRLGEEDPDMVADEGAMVAAGLTEAESILDVASSIYRPARMLRWHYRSRHGSLIAFSNKEFYKNQLIVYPSPTTRSPELGVKFIHVRDGIYEERRNHVEAKRVVATALRHMEQRPGESLGIVSLNATQRELIEDEFEQQLKGCPAAQSFVETHGNGLEPFFIKNLENVQGDERDVIYVSVTFGPTARGHVYQRFGPINGVTGHRRLNVLFTRARRRVVVFSSMLPADVQGGDGASWGARALKGYLQFASTGVLEQAIFSGRDPDSDFEVDVAAALRERGIETVAQVGVAGYFIDLAVKHPTKPDTFLLGLECDGKTYHSSASARDRDRLRQSVLEDLGWEIHRIWSTDWFKAPQREVQRVHQRVQALLAREQAESALGSGGTESEDEEDEVGSLSPVAGSPTAAAAAWGGEAASQPLSAEEVREELLQLREEIDTNCPPASGVGGLLREEMLEALIRFRPRSKDDWLRKIPMDLRLNTDGSQLQAYLGRVLQVTAQLS